VCMGCMIERDATLWTLADMPVGWRAARPDTSSAWTREATAEPDDE
jgi:hypothetical protein